MCSSAGAVSRDVCPGAFPVTCCACSESTLLLALPLAPPLLWEYQESAQMSAPLPCMCAPALPPLGERH